VVPFFNKQSNTVFLESVRICNICIVYRHMQADVDLYAGHSEVFVNLGPLDTYKPVVAVDLGALITPEPYTPQREADFEVQISAMEEGSPTYSTQLPILEDDANCPFRFTTKDATNFKLAFRILYSDLAANKGDRHVGTAIAMLESLKQGLGSRRESLIRDFTIPILQKDTLDFIGTVTFCFVVVKPYPPPHPPPASRTDLKLVCLLSKRLITTQSRALTL